MHDFFGFLWVVAGGFLGATYLLGLKWAKPWTWENIWLAYSVFALIVLPVVMVAINVPNPVAAFALAPRAVLWKILLLGACWGIGAALSGLGVHRVGVGLGMSLLVGTAAASGTLTPLVIHTRGLLFRPKGLMVLASVTVLATGVALVAFAGKERDLARKAHHQSGQKGSLLAGLLICICGGIFSSMLNVGLTLSKPLAQAAVQAGASPAGAENFIWMILLAGGFVVNVIYTTFLLTRNHTWNNFTARGSGRAFLTGLFMALLWYSDAAAYGHGTSLLGSLGTVAGWPVFVSSMMVFSTIWGFATGEWQNSGYRARRYMLAGLAVLVLASGLSMVSKLM
jgi:L-rhamnose-H+ transport protein